MSNRHVTAAIVQAAPIPLAVGDGIARAVALAGEAIAGGARIVAFGETFVGGYPIWLDEAPGAALWDHPGAKAMHRILMEQAVVPGDPRLAPMQELADRTGAVISIGAHFRKRASLYNNQLLFRPHAPVLDHLKLVPTHGERLIWGRGDGSTLAVHDGGDAGTVGSLICWEHWMPLARAAMHNRGEDVHVAAWPTVRETYAVASRHYAFEGRCFVLAAGTVLDHGDLQDGLARTGNDAEARALIDAIPPGQLQSGGSMIIAPDATVLASAGAQAETLFAELDLSLRDAALASLDSDGHYSRPDVFELTVDRRAKDGVSYRD